QWAGPEHRELGVRGHRAVRGCRGVGVSERLFAIAIVELRDRRAELAERRDEASLRLDDHLLADVGLELAVARGEHEWRLQMGQRRQERDRLDRRAEHERDVERLRAVARGADELL